MDKAEDRQSIEAASRAPDPKFTILLPVHRGPHLIPYAVESVLRQRETSYEFFIICDGAPDATGKYARACEARDSRVRAFVFEKGQGRGEAHRHMALARARGRYVAQIADDDLWFDDHLQEMEKLLRTVDFGNVLPVGIRADQSINVTPGDIADPKTRTHVTVPLDIGMGGPTVMGYRLDTYRRLPEGWHRAPIYMHSDRYMWRKFFELPDTRYGTRVVITALVLGSPDRRGWSEAERKEEMARWAERLKDPDECDRIRQLALLVVCRQARAFYMLGPMKFRRLLAMSYAKPRLLVAHLRWLSTALKSRFRRP